MSNPVGADLDCTPVQLNQIIGCATRLSDDYGKLTRDTLDYTGTATRSSADPALDGATAFATQNENEANSKNPNTGIITAKSATRPEEDLSLHDEQTPYDTVIQPSKKFYFDHGHLEMVANFRRLIDVGDRLRTGVALCKRFSRELEQ